MGTSSLKIDGNRKSKKSTKEASLIRRGSSPQKSPLHSSYSQREAQHSSSSPRLVGEQRRQSATDGYITHEGQSLNLNVRGGLGRRRDEDKEDEDIDDEEDNEEEDLEEEKQDYDTQHDMNRNANYEDEPENNDVEEDEDKEVGNERDETQGSEEQNGEEIEWGDGNGEVWDEDGKWEEGEAADY